MDVQMPDMDGLEATVAIRELEKQTGGHTTIIAMTARAMKGDRESCMESGMDGYVAKPIQPKELTAIIESLLPADAGQRSDRPQLVPTVRKPPVEAEPATGLACPIANTPSEGVTEVIDLDALRARVEHDTELLAEMIDLFLDTSPRLLAEVETGVRLRNGKTIQLAAHALKGAMQNIGAAPAAAAALRLETIGNTGDMTLAEDSLTDLNEQFRRLRSALSRISNQVSA
jgi:CheY-like chemotaxis protein